MTWVFKRLHDHNLPQFAIMKSRAKFAFALKKLLSCFLAFVILSHVFVNVGIGVYYHFNKAYVIQKLCENKNNPGIHCNGHCYLSKQLKKAEEGESKSSQLIKEKEEIIANHISRLPGKYFPAISVTKIALCNFSVPVSDHSFSLLRPPVI
jgi:hypothetical protein